jgi:hypothetical protein
MAENRNPYDTLFRGAFADPEAGKELTLFLLPEQHSRRLAGAQVTGEPESLIDQDAKGALHGSAAAVSPAGRQGILRSSSAYVYVLYEHKSYPYRWVTVQLLLYMATLWQRLTGETAQHRSGRLPEILPVVVYHGERAWNRPVAVRRAGRRRRVSRRATSSQCSSTCLPNHVLLGLLALKHARLRMRSDGLPASPCRAGSGRQLARLLEQVYAQVKSAAEVRQLVAAASRKGYHEVEGSYMTYAQELHRTAYGRVPFSAAGKCWCG